MARRKNPNDTAPPQRETYVQRVAREKAEEREIANRLIEWGGGVVDPAEIHAYYWQMQERRKDRG